MKTGNPQPDKPDRPPIGSNGSSLMSTEPDDKTLLERVALKNEAAFRTLYDRYHGRIYHYITTIVGDLAMAEDVATEAFLDVWRGAEKFSGRSQVKTWIFAIARNKAISALRKRRESPLDESFAERLEDCADTPEMASLKASMAETLKACVAHLSAKHREIVHLVYYQEMSIKEVAALLEIPENTVKTRMFHARKQLAALAAKAGLDTHMS